MKFKKILTVIAVIALSLCIGAGAVSFTDVEEHWAYNQIVEYAEKGIVNGYPDGTFKPDEPVTREQFCKIMLNSFGVAGVNRNTASFSDVSADSWSYAFVEGASVYLPGYADGTYLPGSAASRDDVTAAIAKIMGYPVNAAADKEYASKQFSDGAAIDAELLPYVSIAVENGLINGFPDGTFKPDSGITRAEAVTLISRAVSKYNEKTLTWDDAEKYIDTMYAKEEVDLKTVMTVNGYDVSLAEYRYYYLSYCDRFNYYFGQEWMNDPLSVAMFNEYFDADVRVSGILYELSKEYDLKLSLADINQNVFKFYNDLYSIYGNDFPVYVETLHATPNFILMNLLAGAVSRELKDYLYGADSVYYEELASVFENEYVRAKHVLVMFDGKNSKEAAYAVAEEVYNKAISGADFDALIEQYNEDPGMVSSPDGYIFTYGQMVEPFEKATYALDVGAISEIVETTYGYHIIQRLPLDEEIIAGSDAYISTANNAFNEFIYEKTYATQSVNSENYEQLVMEVYAEAGVTVTEPETDEATDISGASAEEIINAINEIKAPEFMIGVIPVEVTDADALKMFTGLDSADGIKEAAVCESMLGSQAYSLVVVKLDDASKARAAAEAMKGGIDQRKWICVEADDIKVSGKGNTVMLIMIDSEYRDSISVEDVTEAFKTVCGGSLDFEI